MSFSISKWFILLGGLVILVHQITLHFRYTDRKPVTKPSTWQQFLSFMAVGVGLGAVAVLIFDIGRFSLPAGKVPGIGRGMGVVLFSIGVLLRIRALQHLNENYAPDLRIKAGGSLIQGGVYGLVRHPFYLSVLLLVFGAGFALENWLVLGIAVGLVFVVRHRIRVEEQMLLSYFKEEYRLYRQQVPMLIPRIPLRKLFICIQGEYEEG